MPLEEIVEFVEMLMPVSWISVDEARAGSARVLHVTGRRLETIPQLEQKIERFCHQNPVVAHVLEGNFEPALKISDFTTFCRFKQTVFFNEIACFMPGWRDQAAIAVKLPNSSLGLGLNRDRAFNDEELLMLQLIQPHIERVLRRCTQYLQVSATSALTAREREVLHWVAEGKRDSEIAVMLRISVRTAEQHARVCLHKLGVETRAAAAAEVWRARQGGARPTAESATPIRRSPRQAPS
jgi:DNA-binding CsgD family transcriptional regulator